MWRIVGHVDDERNMQQLVVQRRAMRATRNAMFAHAFTVIARHNDNGAIATGNDG